MTRVLLKLPRFCFILTVMFLYLGSSYAAPSDHFVTTWDTQLTGNTNNTSITIKTYPGLTYAYDVDWDNDGIFDELELTGDTIHDFTTPGIKTIRIRGDFPSLFSKYNDDISKIISIDQWGTYPWRRMNSSFYKASNLINNASDSPNLSLCTDLSYMFSGASQIGKSTESSNWDWDTSTVTSMQGMFSSAGSFNQNIASWDTSNLNNMSYMFRNAFSFNQNLSLWDIQNITNFTNIFQNINLTIEHYDSLLINWSSQAIHQNLSFNGGTSIYCSQAAKNAHDLLTGDFSWTIEDNGMCDPQLTIISHNSVLIDEGESFVTRVITSDPDFNNVSFTITGGEDQNAFSINLTSGTLIFNSPPDFENPIDINGNNSYIVEITATDDGSPIETTTQEITVLINNIYENILSDDFVTTWKTDNSGTTNNTSITLPLRILGDTNDFYDVDWNNDGVFDEFNINTPVVHDFGTPGLKTIRVRSTSSTIHFKILGDRNKLISIDQWGTIPWGFFYRAFYDAKNLVINATDIPNLSACKNLSYMFFGAKSVGGITESSNWNWDTATINNFSSMFNGATQFNKNIENWDTTGVTLNFQEFPNIGFYEMFKDATSFNQNIGSWETSSVYIMASMFENATSFNQDLSAWKVHRVAYFDEMFKNTSLSPANYDALLNSWSNQNVRKNMEFDAGKSIYCSPSAAVSRDSLVNIKNWTIYDQGQCLSELNIVSESIVFADENQLEVIKIKTTDPDNDVVNFAITGGDDFSFFSINSMTGELSFITPPDYENPLDFDNKNSYIVEITATDNGSPQETSVQTLNIYINNLYENLINDDFVTTWKTDNVGRSNDSSIYIKTNQSYEYFYDIDWNNDGVFDDFGIVGDVTHDYGIASIQTVRIRGKFPSIRFYQDYDQEKLLSIDQWGTNSWESMLFAFSNTKNLIINAPDTPNLSNCTTLAGMFINSPLVGNESENSNWNWNTKTINDMRKTFNNATAFNQDIGHWNTARVEQMDSMFENAQSFNQNIGQWNTSNVQSMSRLFKDAYSFNQNLSQWQITQNTDFRYIFNNVSLSVANYDALLVAWNEKITLSNLTLDAGNSIYCSQEAVDARSNMTTAHGWSIHDKGQCEDTLTIVSNDIVFVDENSTPVIQLVATNSDFDNISYAITGGEDQAKFSLNSTTGDLSFIDAQDYEVPQDFDQDNSYLVEVTASDDGIPQEFFTQSLTIYIKNQYENLPSDDFVTTWKTNNNGGSNDTSISIKANLSLDYLYNVDWDNDGVFDEFAITGDITHDFGTSGIKTIRISGLFPGLFFEYSEDKEKIISIDQWGSNPWKSPIRAFFEASNLVNNAIDIPNLSNTNNISSMFSGANKIGNANEMGNWNWDTSTITSMNGTFANASHFNKDLSQWNTSRVTSMRSMFYNASLFNQNIGGWDTANVIGTSSMFSRASSFDQDLSQWNVQRLINMNYMFNHMRLSIKNYEALLLGWSSQNLIPNREFDGGKSLYCSQEASDARSYIITSFNWTIYDNGKCLPQLSIVSNDNVFTNENQTNVTKVVTSDPNFDTATFSITGGDDASLFTIDPSSGVIVFVTPPDYENPEDFDSNNSYIVEVTAMNNGSPPETATQTITVFINNMYENLANDDFVITWKTDNPGSSNNASIKINVSGSYTYAYNVDWNNDGIFDEFNISDNIIHNFGSAGNKTIRISGLFPAMPNIDSLKLISIDQWGTNQWQYLNNAFYNAKNLVNKANDAPNLSNIYSLSNMFSGATVIGSYNENSNWNWDTSNIYKMSYMFNDASSFNQDISNWDTSKVTEFDYMFNQATAFNQDIGRWDISNAYSLRSMFAGATSFNQNIGYWNTSRIRIMRETFKDAKSFNQDIGYWDTSNVDDMNSTFKDASLFDQDLSNWNISKVTKLEEIFNGGILSVANYDALLVAWSAQDIASNLSFHAGNSFYCSSQAQSAHENLINNYNWTIQDKGQCESVLTIISPSNLFAEENQSYVGQVVTTDPDFDTITYSLSGGDDIDKFAIDSLTGELTFIISPDFENPTDSNMDNVFTIEVTAVDDQLIPESVTQVLTISIINVYENLPSDDFVTTWNTELPGYSGNKTIRITTNSNEEYSYNVDWNNDGFFDEFNITGNVTHVYSVPGIKTIRISGLFPHFVFYYNNGDDNKRLISIDQWGSNPWKSMRYAFQNAVNVVNKAQDTPNLSQCNNLQGMFSGAKSIGAVNETAKWNWNTKNINYMSGMFNNAYLFNQDISQWDTSSNLRLDYTFANAKSFNQNLSYWSVERVSSFQNMFNQIKLSTDNYDSLLVEWNKQRLLSSKEFDAGYSIYCSIDAQNARYNMVNNRNWTVNDNGSCTQVLSIISEDIVEVKENSVSVNKIITSASDSEEISFNILERYDSDLFIIDPVSGLIAFINPPDFENPQSSDNTNTYIVEVTALKGGPPQEIATQLITVNVINAYEDIPVDVSAAITSEFESLNAGDRVVLTTTITNTGSNNANNLKVLDFIHPGLSIISRNCQTIGNAVCYQSGENEIINLANNRSSSVTYSLVAQVIDDSFAEYTYRVYVETSQPEFDENINDNFDNIIIQSNTIFSNGFED